MLLITALVEESGIGPVPACQRNLPRNASQQQALPDRVQLLALLEDEPSSPDALLAAQWVILRHPHGPGAEKAAEVILQEHTFSTNLVILCEAIERSDGVAHMQLLEASPGEKPVRRSSGQRPFLTGRIAKGRGKLRGLNQKATAAAENFSARYKGFLPDKAQRKEARHDLARPELAELQRLTIGNPRRRPRARISKETPLSSLDYRGNVVLLIFRVMRRLSATSCRRCLNSSTA